MNETAIHVDNLERHFGSFVAVDRISFDVARGEIFGFLGANGAGKSTTIRMLCGLLSSTSGSATVAGYDINKEPEQVKRHIGYMSQKFSLYSDLTVSENIEFFGGTYGLEGQIFRERRAWAIEMAGLEKMETSLTKDLPLGWKQRLALGCAVLHRPQIVFLDEPTSGVDPVARRTFWDLINAISNEGSTVFVTTHYLDEAEYCNRIALINAGRLISQGSPRELKSTTIKNRIFEIESDSAAKALDELKKMDPVEETSLFGNYVHVSVKDEYDAEKEIPSALESAGVSVTRIEPILPSLEDVFIHLIEQDTPTSH